MGKYNDGWRKIFRHCERSVAVHDCELGLMDGRAALAMADWLRGQTDLGKRMMVRDMHQKGHANSAAKPPSGSKRLFRKISRVGPVHVGCVTG